MTMLRKYAIVIVALILFAGGQAVAIIGLVRAVQVAHCVNANLGQRNAPAARDAASNIAWSQHLLNTLNARHPDEQFQRFKVETASHIAVLKADQAVRAASPLGKC